MTTNLHSLHVDAFDRDYARTLSRIPERQLRTMKPTEDERQARTLRAMLDLHDLYRAGPHATTTIERLRVALGLEEPAAPADAQPDDLERALELADHALDGRVDAATALGEIKRRIRAAIRAR